ncbi:hypothetical protein ACFV2X_50920 [Streptomyces sp. NPDC059679]|uniref:hypothetical protein n=1 Tax=Streptomyces sp. NPDC059679 TaxID=3346903 RepID=UPI00367C185A
MVGTRACDDVAGPGGRFMATDDMHSRDERWQGDDFACKPPATGKLKTLARQRAAIDVEHVRRAWRALAHWAV